MCSNSLIETVNSCAELSSEKVVGPCVTISPLKGQKSRGFHNQQRIFN